MPKRGELYNAMVNGSSSDALMLTCTHLYDNTIYIIEDDWINFSALIGKTPELSYGSLWNNINKNILECIDAEEVDATDIMMCTVKLMLLYKRCNTNYQPLTIQLLRQRVINLFPEKAILSPAGLLKYSQILSVLNDIKNSENSTESDVSLFCQRILAGLSKVMSENSYDDMRYCLEYLCKKKIVIPLPTQFPCPNMEEAEQGEIIWFLWGALLCFYSDKNGSHKYNETTKDIVFTNYSLFIANWKKSSNKDRLGLLWGVPYALNTNVEPDWTYTERVIIDKLQENGVDIWKSFLSEKDSIKVQEQIQAQEIAQAKKYNKNGKKSNTNSIINQNPNQNALNEYGNPVDPLDILSTYIPRKSNYDDEETNEEIEVKMAQNNLYKLQYNNQQEDLTVKMKNASLYDKQLEQLEKTVPFVRTLYIDKNSKFNTNSSQVSEKDKTNKKKSSKTNSNTRLQLDTTDILIKQFDSKYFD
jgi:hypothetical protein